MDARRVVRERECRRLTGLSRTTRWDLERKGQFPRRHRITAHSVGWLECEVQEWIRRRTQRAGEAGADPAAAGLQAGS
jgi:prophage regulatory protein